MTTAKLCPSCKRRPELHASYLVTCRCPHCYDGSEDASSANTLCGWGETAPQAVEAWNQQVTDREEDAA